MKTITTIIIIAALLLFILANWNMIVTIHTYFSAPTQTSNFKIAQAECLSYMVRLKSWFLFWLFTYIVFRTIIDRNHEWKKRFWE